MPLLQKNIGTWDAIMRITGGLTGLAWSTSRMARKPHSYTPLFIAMLSGMKVAEGITRFCPMLYMIGQNTLDKKTQQHGNKNAHQNNVGETNDPIINSYR